MNVGKVFQVVPGCVVSHVCFPLLLSFFVSWFVGPYSHIILQRVNNAFHIMAVEVFDDHSQTLDH